MSELSKLKLMDIANKIPLFKELDPLEKEQIISIKNIVKVIKQDTKFIVDGEHDDGFYILLNGSASILQDDKKIAEVKGGQFVGEVGFICREPRSASVIANTDLVTFYITRQCFLDLPLTLRDKIKDQLIGGLVHRIQNMNREVARLQRAASIFTEEEEKITAPVTGIELSND